MRFADTFLKGYLQKEAQTRAGLFENFPVSPLSRAASPEGSPVRKTSPGTRMWPPPGGIRRALNPTGGVLKNLAEESVREGRRQLGDTARMLGVDTLPGAASWAGYYTQTPAALAAVTGKVPLFGSYLAPVGQGILAAETADRGYRLGKGETERRIAANDPQYAHEKGFTFTGDNRPGSRKRVVEWRRALEEEGYPTVPLRNRQQVEQYLAAKMIAKRLHPDSDDWKEDTKRLYREAQNDPKEFRERLHRLGFRPPQLEQQDYLRVADEFGAAPYTTYK